jgi:RNA polymerase sigma-70 factor, ECF subfamily
MSSSNAPAPADELDELMLARAQRGDRAAAHCFVVTYQGRVFGLVARLLYAHPHLVDDVTQDVFLKALRALPRFEHDGPARLSTWLLTIATRHVLDLLKHLRRPLPVPPSTEPATSVDVVVEQRQRHRHISQALAELPDDQRVVLVLRAYHELDVREVAELLGVEEGTVKSRLSRARAALRALLPTDGSA